MSDKPLILVTNADSISANGIAALVSAVEDLGEIVIVAPDKPQSGMGHAITINHPLRLKKSDLFSNHEAYTCSGTPVDCVKLAIYEVLKQRPTLLVSGINHGSNAATNVLYSGTMSAAVEGAIEDIPSIGFSLLNHAPDADFSHTIDYVRNITQQALENGMANHTCLNVNIPAENIQGVKVCRQGVAFWADSFDKREDPFGRNYFWLTGNFRESDNAHDTDLHALSEGYISIVPTQFDMTAHSSLGDINKWKF